MDIDGQPVGPAQPVPAFDAPAPTPPVPILAAEPAAPPPNATKTPRGTGWWAALKSRALEVGDRARAANQARPAEPPQQLPAAQIAATSGVQVPTGPSVQLPAPGADPEPPEADEAAEREISTVLRPAEQPTRPILVVGATPVSVATPVRPRPASPQPVLPAPITDWQAPQTITEDPDRTVIRADGEQTIVVAEDPDRTVLRPAANPAPSPRGGATAVQRRPENELSLWDDYGIADDAGLRIDRDASRSAQLAQLLGASAMPLAKVLTFVGVLAVTILALVTLATRLITLDTLVVTAPSPTPTVAPSPDAEPTQAPPPDETETAEPAPAEPVTPSMAPGAKECDPGVWAGPQTSCALANVVAQQVDREIAETVVVEAFSSSSNRNYRLECVPGQGITCTGLDGVEGVYVWLVTQG